MGVLTEVGWTIGDGAANVVGDSHGEVGPVDETDVVPIKSTGISEGPFSHRCRRHSVDDIHGGQGMFLLTSSQAGIGTWVLGEITAAASPDASRPQWHR